MRITQETKTTTTIELTEEERFQLSRILAWYRTHGTPGTEDYELSLSLSYNGIDTYMTERGRRS